ncbi:hypothetical protein E4U60_004862 [Claviceps pazoutovae]|uniref:LysM domain-containing protein n=1 Tax=Claviceps pazoutovae TaxID=1649127 RepID=A0A9P7M8K7_9HYPO|nr:hypothetical protein E4U60_004862 [Claviceps pazoutovae]
MTDRDSSAHGSTNLLTPARAAATSQPPGSNIIRPRSYRRENASYSDGTTTNLEPGSSTESPRNTSSRSTDVSRFSEHTRHEADPNSRPGRHELAQFLGDSWLQRWTSVQAFASNIMSNSNKSLNDPSTPEERSHLRRKNYRLENWGPVPPSNSSLTHSIAAGSSAHRQAALRAAKTASVLESYEGVNGGLDVIGKHKRRKSDESVPHACESAQQLVYVHEVQPNDTYAGIVLRYKCREDIFRKSNRLWSQDSVQTRKWLILPVDACEVKGRPIDPLNCETDSLDPAPSKIEDHQSKNGASRNGTLSDSRSSALMASTHCEQESEDGMPWTHVRWVQMEAFSKPIQIVRVVQHSLGYFPPRRKRSVRTISPNTSSRRSSGLSNFTLGLNDGSSPCQFNSPSRQPSLPGRPSSSHDRVDSETADNRPSWMRRPGGVGSMNRSVKEPGPDNDYLNLWAKKHLPGLDLDTMPSMSVMGSDIAHFGFGLASTTLVESSFEEGKELDKTSRLGSGLDRAAAVVEHWLRGALVKRPSTPSLGNRSRPTGLSSKQDFHNLIELTHATGQECETMHLPTSSCTSATARIADVMATRDNTSLDSKYADSQKKDK